VAERLLARGYSDQDVHKIFGENLIRVFEEVWK
jgi:microsomal dipeptidase-like Zn-dependent dipeptidase